MLLASECDDVGTKGGWLYWVDRFVQGAAPRANHRDVMGDEWQQPGYNSKQGTWPPRCATCVSVRRTHRLRMPINTGGGGAEAGRQVRTLPHSGGWVAADAKRAVVFPHVVCAFVVTCVEQRGAPAWCWEMGSTVHHQ